MSLAVTTGPSYPRLIVEALARYPTREAFVSGDRRLTYAQATDLLSRLQQALHANGVHAGTVLAALSPNIPEIFLAQVAAGLNDACYSGLHPLGSVDDHAALCEDAGATTLLVHPVYAEVGAALAERVDSITAVLTLGPSDLGRDVLAMADAMPPARLDPPEVDPEATIWMPYTGGTTGRSKGVMHSHRGMVQGAVSVLSSWEMPASPRYLACAPITHAAMLPIAPTLMRGGTVVLTQGFTPDVWLDIVERERVDYAFLVPTMINALLDHPELDPRRTRTLETVVYGAAPMPASRLTEALEVFGPVFAQGYGQTESLGMGTVLMRHEHDPGRRPDLLTSCGRATLGGLAVLLDEDGDESRAGQVGEVCLRGGWTMNGYSRDAGATARTLHGGWLHTGDLAQRDDEGYLHIVDRKKDLIITGAFNVYPREIEAVIATEPEIAAVAVIGIPDSRWGEAVTAFIVPRPGATVDPEAVRLLVRGAKGPHQAPKTVHVVDSLPLTAVGKLDKKALREPFWAGASRSVN